MNFLIQVSIEQKPKEGLWVVTVREPGTGKWTTRTVGSDPEVGHVAAQFITERLRAAFVTAEAK